VAEKAGNDNGLDRRPLGLDAGSGRLDTIVFLDRASAGPTEVAERLGVSVSAAARHLEEMREAGLIEVVGERKGEGAAEPLYRTLVRTFWSDEEWAELSYEERWRLSSWIVQLIFSDVDEALKSGSFDARIDAHASRTASVVDEQGWRELTRLQAEALEAVFAVEAASAERLAERGEDGITAMSVMLCFEMPARHERRG
jgi:DNA-binding transcriptional ArsR family regulator